VCKNEARHDDIYDVGQLTKAKIKKNLCKRKYIIIANQMSFDANSSSTGPKDYPGQDEKWRKPCAAIVSPQIRPAFPAYFPAS